MLQERDTHINTQVRGLLAWNLEQTRLKHARIKRVGVAKAGGFRNNTHALRYSELWMIWDIFSIQFSDNIHVKCASFGVPDVSEWSCALKVGFGFRFIAGGLPSVRVRRDAVEAHLVAPSKEQT